MVRIERRRFECPADSAPQRREEIASTRGERGRGGWDPLAFHPGEPIGTLPGFLGSQRLQRRDQCRGVEPLSMIAIDPDELFERSVRCR